MSPVKKVAFKGLVENAKIPKKLLLFLMATSRQETIQQDFDFSLFCFLSKGNFIVRMESFQFLGM